MAPTLARAEVDGTIDGQVAVDEQLLLDLARPVNKHFGETEETLVRLVGPVENVDTALRFDEGDGMFSGSR